MYGCLQRQKQAESKYPESKSEFLLDNKSQTYACGSGEPWELRVSRSYHLHHHPLVSPVTLHQSHRRLGLGGVLALILVKVSQAFPLGA